MKMGQWLTGVLPVMAACCWIYIWMRENGQQKRGLPAKCGVTWLVVCTAAIGLTSKGVYPLKSLIFWALLLFLAADALLELYFAAGLLAFGGGHLLLMLWLFGREAPTAASLVIWVVIAGLVVTGFWPEIVSCRRDKKKLLVFLYPAAVAAMVSAAVVLPVNHGMRYLPAAVGAVLFAVSDYILGKRHFGEICAGLNRAALVLYYLGILLIALAAG